ncbi:MAG: hypothetical protein KJ025_21165 [Burkholderiales bacterium]|nr:hypothetical protein [Burkholderiales bacterium]
MASKGFALLAAGALLAAAASPAALAHGGHYPRARVGVYIGGPLWWGPRFYYPPAYYYYPPYPYYYQYPPVATGPASPPVYVERGETAAESDSTSWWYYCANPAGYYPYVKQCPGGWQRVAPRPPGE